MEDKKLQKMVVAFASGYGGDEADMAAEEWLPSAAFSFFQFVLSTMSTLRNTNVQQSDGLLDSSSHSISQLQPSAAEILLRLKS
jgi:hypothetical protein